MAMRITQSLMTDRLLDDLGRITQKLDCDQRAVATGRRLQKPSDDPVGAQRAILARAELDGTKQFQANVAQARGWLDTTDEALSGLTDILHRARELTVQGASDAIGPTGRQNIALEMDQLADALKSIGNTSYAGAFVFGGTRTTTPPYDVTTAPPNDTFSGDDNAIAREIGPGISVQINVTVDTGTPPLLGSGVPGDGGLISTLRGIAAHLRGGTPADSTALQNADLKALETSLDTLNVARAQVGATTNRLDSAEARLGASEDAATKLLSDTEDTDIAEAMLSLTTQQTVYQAALRTGANIIQPSLLDFLR